MSLIICAGRTVSLTLLMTGISASSPTPNPAPSTIPVSPSAPSTRVATKTASLILFLYPWVKSGTGSAPSYSSILDVVFVLICVGWGWLMWGIRVLSKARPQHFPHVPTTVRKERKPVVTSCAYWRGQNALIIWLLPGNQRNFLRVHDD